MIPEHRSTRFHGTCIPDGLDAELQSFSTVGVEAAFMHLLIHRDSFIG